MPQILLLVTSKQLSVWAYEVCYICQWPCVVAGNSTLRLGLDHRPRDNADMQLLCQRLVALQVLSGLPCGCLGILQLFAKSCEVVLGQDCNTGTILGSVADVLGRAVEIAGQVGWLCVWIN